MKKTTALLIATLAISTAKAQGYSGIFEPVKEEAHQLDDFALKGKVKTVTTTQYASNEDGKLELDEYNATTIQHFNTDGNLVSTTILKSNGDTLYQELFSYNENGVLSQKIGEYDVVTHYEYGPHGIANITTEKLNRRGAKDRIYSYDKMGRLISDDMKGHFTYNYT